MEIHQYTVSESSLEKVGFVRSLLRCLWKVLQLEFERLLMQPMVSGGIFGLRIKCLLC